MAGLAIITLWGRRMLLSGRGDAGGMMGSFGNKGEERGGGGGWGLGVGGCMPCAFVQ